MTAVLETSHGRENRRPLRLPVAPTIAMVTLAVYLCLQLNKKIVDITRKVTNTILLYLNPLLLEVMNNTNINDYIFAYCMAINSLAM